jgi:hypothetical protein
MRVFGLLCTALGTAVICAATGANAAVPAQPQALRGAIESVGSVETVQYVWGGRRYCWYPAGWHGPGWYWCGYAYRVGLGWGGPFGWHGWRHGERFGRDGGERHERFGRSGDERHEHGIVGERGGRTFEREGRGSGPSQQSGRSIGGRATTGAVGGMPGGSKGGAGPSGGAAGGPSGGAAGGPGGGAAGGPGGGAAGGPGGGGGGAGGGRH